MLSGNCCFYREVLEELSSNYPILAKYFFFNIPLEDQKLILSKDFLVTLSNLNWKLLLDLCEVFAEPWRTETIDILFKDLLSTDWSMKEVTLIELFENASCPPIVGTLLIKYMNELQSKNPLLLKKLMLTAVNRFVEKDGLNPQFYQFLCHHFITPFLINTDEETAVQLWERLNSNKKTK